MLLQPESPAPPPPPWGQFCREGLAKVVLPGDVTAASLQGPYPSVLPPAGSPRVRPAFQRLPHLWGLLARSSPPILPSPFPEGTPSTVTTPAPGPPSPPTSPFLARAASLSPPSRSNRGTWPAHLIPLPSADGALSASPFGLDVAPAAGNFRDFIQAPGALRAASPVQPRSRARRAGRGAALGAEEEPFGRAAPAGRRSRSPLVEAPLHGKSTDLAVRLHHTLLWASVSSSVTWESQQVPPQDALVSCE
ncbi:WW domain-binding protein 11-like [Cavia porcellus]|uniref:WW domain-binding protein 11-like n=1 Tax=Cavia porcellus TaxID=10141 RepID=UPI002FE08CB3